MSLCFVHTTLMKRPEERERVSKPREHILPFYFGNASDRRKVNTDDTLFSGVLARQSNTSKDQVFQSLNDSHVTPTEQMRSYKTLDMTLLNPES